MNALKQEEIAVWTGVEGNGSIHDGDGTIGQVLTMKWQRVYLFVSIRVILVLPSLTQRLLKKKKEKVHL